MTDVAGGRPPQEAADRRLRVAMVVESRTVPAWQAALAAALTRAPGLELEVYAIGTRPTAPRRPLLLGLYERLDARVFRCRPEALARDRVDTRGDVPASVAGRDVVLDFASSDPVALARGVRFGAWTVVHGPTEDGLYETRIDAHLENGMRATLYSSYGAIDQASPHRTRNRALWKAQRAFVYRLDTIRRLGSDYLEACVGAHDSTIVSALPSNRAVAGQATRAALGVVFRRLQSVRGREAWFIAARPRRPGSVPGLQCGGADGFTPIEWSSRTAVADPFVFEDGGDTYLFFEDEDPARGKAHISYARIDAEARPVGPVTPALRTAHHLSYPFVFRHDGEIFMIPESNASRRVELYRASRFPDTWTLEQVLLDDLHAFDATLHVDEDRFWLFAAVADEATAPNDELHLFSSTSLTGLWTPHPANPIVSDVRSARPAGRLFHHEGTLIRPSQDCAQRYGHALVFNRIDVLTHTAYRETPVGRIDPTWHPGVVATHTYNFGDAIEVIDGKRFVSRYPKRARMRARNGS